MFLGKVCHVCVQVKTPLSVLVTRDCAVVLCYSPGLTCHVACRLLLLFCDTTDKTHSGPGLMVTSGPQSLIRACQSASQRKWREKPAAARLIQFLIIGFPFFQQISVDARTCYFSLIHDEKYRVYCNPVILLNRFWFAQKIWLMTY